MIRVRLTLWFTAILAATFLVAGIGVRWAIEDSIHETVDKDLRARLAGMREFLSHVNESLREELEEQSSLTPAGARFRIAGRDGEWIFQTEKSKQWGPRAGREGAATIVADGVPVRVLTAPVNAGTIQIGVPLDEFHEMLSDFTWTALIASPLLLLLAAAGGYWMSSRALAPVDSITRTAQQIGALDLSKRLPLRGVGDELDRLSGTLNAMFERLEGSFARVVRFTADASHELRTPVAVIRTTAELTRGKPRSQAEYERALDRILVESERTTSLIEDLLLLARADATADGITSERVELSDVVRSACDDMRILADGRNIQLRFEAAGDAFAVDGDEHALRRMLLALFDNALKFTPPGGGCVSVSMSAVDRSVLITVRDPGIGIGAEDLPHIFERFYRASKDRLRSAAGGTGLGLAIAQWIAERHGGAITVESAAGSGSTFVVRLPLSSPLIQNPRRQ